MIINRIVSSVILLILDGLWLKFYMGNKYKNQIFQIQNSKMSVRPVFAVIAYTLMVIGLNLFVIPNIRPSHKLYDSIKYGFLFGIVVYGIYDMTCATIFKDWDIKLALVDILWGGLVYFISAYVGSFFHNTNLNIKIHN